MGKEKARDPVTDVAAVLIGRRPANTDNTVISRSFGEVVDLIGEGVIEGITSGDYKYQGTDEAVGYDKINFESYTATGTLGEADTTPAKQQRKELGFLRSVYWNDVPVVDEGGFYNFPSVNLQYVNGNPAGDIPVLSTKMSTYAGLAPDEELDLSINRSIGERLYGPEIKGGENSPTINRNAKLKDGTTIDKYAKTYSILNKEVTKIEVNIKVPALSETLQAGKKLYKGRKPVVGYGDTKARTVNYRIYYRPIFDKRFSQISIKEGNQTTPTQSVWKLGVSEQITGKIDTAYIRRSALDLSSKHLQDVNNFEGWEIRIVRTTPESLTSFLRNSTYVDSIVEVYGTRLRYPYSSMVYSQFDARSFTRLPARAYDAHLTKVLIPNNYNPILKKYGDSRLATEKLRTNTEITITDNIVTQWEEIDTPATPFWDGDFKKENGDYIKEWTDNPAWCFHDILTNPRYGVGEFIKESEVDKWTLYEIAQFCDILVPDTYGALEPNFTINHIITSREEAFKVLNDLTSVFRGIAYFTNGSIFAVQDKFKDPVYQFNNSSVINGNFTYSSSAQKARHTVAIVRYNDKRNLFQPTIEYLEDEEAVRRYGIREIETTAVGCTSRGQARRFAKWILASEFNETETVSFSVGNDGAYLMPGDVVQIYDNYRSPLKYSGRTNAVRPLILDDNEGQQNVAKPTDWDSDSFNSVILDQALNFNENNLYKFSILTPTYSLSSGDASDIRRNQIQNLLFSGAHTNTITGDYRSDFMESGSGVCTQIYFNTGDFFQKDITINAGGTGNKLNFSDYVITGYTNTGVNAESPEGPPNSISYSGGCYSGENLIWSIEPNNPDDPEFVSGSYSNFKIINIKEEENTYGVSALAYSTGKYDAITAAGVVVTSEKDQAPLFPYDQNILPTNIVPQSAGQSPLLFAIQGKPFPEEDYDTVEIRFPQAGYKVITDENNNFTIKNPLVDDQLQEDTDPTKDVYNINYTLGFFKDSEISSAYATYGLPASPANDKVYVIDASKFEKYQEFSIDVLPYSDREHEGQKGGPLADRMYGEYLITNAPYNTPTNYWVSLFATSVTNQVSRGLAVRIAITATSATSSTIRLLELSNLTTEDISVTSETPVHNIEEINPVFSWVTTAKGLSNLKGTDSVTVDGTTQLYTDGIPQFGIEINQDVVEYRLTARDTDRASTDQSINTPSSTIYFEATGYAPQDVSPTFLMDSEILNPNKIEELRIDPHVTGWKDGKPVENWETQPNSFKSIPANADWLSVSGSGINIKNITSLFPLREYDFVVEMHDGEGNTSANNKIYDNTIKGKVSETWDPYDFAANTPTTYDILGVKIPAPSGILFCQKGESNTEFVDGVTAAKFDLPYVATANVYPDGNLNVRIAQAAGLGAVPTRSEEQIKSFFSNTAGVVYYFTTGDNTIVPSTTIGTSKVNMAPQFDLKFTPDTTSDPGNKKAYQEMTDTTAGKAFGGIMTLDEDYRGNVFRRIYEFPDDQDPLDFIMRIPYLGSPQVANIQLSLGMYDDLHSQIYFDEDGKSKTYNEGDDKTPLLFKSHTINFSRSINEGIPYTTAEDTDASIINSKGEYKEDYSSSESIALAEVGLTSASEKAQAFTAWGQAILNPQRFGVFSEDNEKSRQQKAAGLRDSFSSSQAEPVGQTKYIIKNKTTGSNAWDWSSAEQTSKKTYQLGPEGKETNYWGWNDTFSLMQIFYDYWGIIYKPDWSPGVEAQDHAYITTAYGTAGSPISAAKAASMGIAGWTLAARRANFASDWVDPFRNDLGNLGVLRNLLASDYGQMWEAGFYGAGKDEHLPYSYWNKNMWEPRMWEFDFEKDGVSLIKLDWFASEDLTADGKIDMMKTGNWDYVTKMIRATEPLVYILPRDSMFTVQENTEIIFRMEVWPQPIRRNETESGREDRTIAGWEIAARFSAKILSPTGSHRDTVVFPLGTPHSSLDYSRIPIDDGFFEVFPKLAPEEPSSDDFMLNEGGAWVRSQLRRRLKRMNFNYHFNEDGQIILEEHPLAGDGEYFDYLSDNPNFIDYELTMTNAMGRFAGGGRETQFNLSWYTNKPVKGNNQFYANATNPPATPTDKLSHWNTRFNSTGYGYGQNWVQIKDKIYGTNKGGDNAGGVPDPRMGMNGYPGGAIAKGNGLKVGWKISYRLDEWCMACKSQYTRVRGNIDQEAWGSMRKDRGSFSAGADAAARENWPAKWASENSIPLDPLFLFDWGIIKTK